MHTQEDGCGALTGWDWRGATPSSYPLVYFNLPFFIKSGCVERAIASAGGPQISCQAQGLDIKKRLREKRSAVAVPASRLPVSSTPSYTYTSSATSRPTYVPMTWAVQAPVVITSTMTAAPVVFTTVVPETPTFAGVSVTATLTS